MKLNPVINTTSSRLDRETQLSPEVEAQEEAIIASTIAYCNESLNKSRFFTKLKNGEITQPLMQYTFLQYYFWRDQLHKWFGLCIEHPSFHENRRVETRHVASLHLRKSRKIVGWGV